MTKIVRVPKDCPHNGHNGGYYVVDSEGRRRGHVRRDHYMGGWWARNQLTRKMREHLESKHPEKLS